MSLGAESTAVQSPLLRYAEATGWTPLSRDVTQEGQAHGRAILERLNERGLVEARGERRGRVYHLSAKLYEDLHLKAGYVRARGFDRIRQEAMVLEFTQAHGRIARSEAADLCNVSGDQASRLLRGLAKKGKLTLAGEKRGSHYMPVAGK